MTARHSLEDEPCRDAGPDSEGPFQLSLIQPNDAAQSKPLPAKSAGGRR
jgi:hypothetical protein